MSIYALPASLALAINLTLCLIVFLNNPKGVANRVFTLLILSFVAWNTGELIMISSNDPDIALLGVKAIFAGVFLFPVFFLHFSFLFPQKLTRFLEGWHSAILYVGPVALAGSLSSFSSRWTLRGYCRSGPSSITSSVLKGRWSPSLLALVLALIGLGCFSWGVVNFIISYRQTKITHQRLQILYLLVGIIAMFVIGLVLQVANSFFQFGYSFFFVASLYSLLISFFFALAIVKYRLLDIHFIIRGSILYSILSGLVLVIYVLFIKNVCDILAKKFDTNSLLVEGAFVLVLVFLLRPLERRVEELIDRFFYRDRYLFRLKFFEFTRTLLEIMDLQTLLRATVDFISQALVVEKLGIWILDGEAGSYRMLSQKGLPGDRSFLKESPFVAYLNNSRRAVELEYIKDIRPLQPEIREMMAARSSWSFPSSGGTGCWDFCWWGRKRTEKTSRSWKSRPWKRWPPPWRWPSPARFFTRT